MKGGETYIGKVLEISVDKIKFTKIELPNGPTYEVFKNEVVKIKFRNGYTEVFDKSITKNDTLQKTKARYDTCNYSKVYIVYTAYGEETCPMYFNGQYIWTLKPYSRMEYTLFSQGDLTVQRMNFNKKKAGPTVTLSISHGQFYGLLITMPYPQGLDPNKKFAIEVFKDSTEFSTFMEKTYWGIEPLPGSEFKGQESFEKPITL